MRRDDVALTITKLFQPAQLTTSVAVLFTMPSVGVLKNGRVRLTNTSASAVPVTLYSAAASAPSDATTCCLSAVSVGAGGYLDVDIPTMASGDTLRGMAGTAAVITVHEIGGVIHS